MKEQILARTKAIGINSLKLLNDLPNNPAGWAIAKQLAKCSTSIGANYRAATRAKSDPDFINKLKIVEEALMYDLRFTKYEVGGTKYNLQYHRLTALGYRFDLQFIFCHERTNPLSN